jgi:hypothetical protein
MTAQCREGHESSELDYCSICGAPMPAVGSGGEGFGTLGGSLVKGSRASGADACPSCGEPRTFAEARFCEVCRYDFVAGKGGPPPALGASTPRKEPVSPPGWELVVTVDASLDTEPDPANPCPEGETERVFPFDVAEMLVGRRDDRRDIRPEISLGDPGTSRRHAKFVKNGDGSISLQDLASLNGTRLNATDVVPGSRRALEEGDAVTLGRWTRIRLRRKS